MGSVNLHEAVELGKYATELGYDSLSAVTRSTTNSASLKSNITTTPLLKKQAIT